jgi:hypothetical protein
MTSQITCRKLVEKDTIEALDKNLLSAPISQEEMNKLLVNSLLAGRKDMFEHLLSDKVNPKADIQTLAAKNINKYLEISEFNIADLPPLHALRDRDTDEQKKLIGDRLKNAQEILNEIKEGTKYNIDPTKFNLPVMAAYFEHSDLMSKLIEETTTGKQPWDFNQSIGTRNLTALACCIALDDVNSNYQNIASKIMDNAESIKLNPTSQQRLGLSHHFNNGNLNKASEYFKKLENVAISEAEIMDLIKNTPGVILLFSNKKDETLESSTNKILPIMDRISSAITKLPDNEKPGILKEAMRSVEVAIENSESAASTQLLESSFMTMLSNEKELVEKINLKASERINELEPPSPQQSPSSPTSKSPSKSFVSRLFKSSSPTSKSPTTPL